MAEIPTFEKRKAIAFLHQIEKKTPAYIQSKLDVSYKTVLKWRERDLSRPETFEDEARSGRPEKKVAISEAQFRQEVEADVHGNISRVAALTGVS